MTEIEKYVKKLPPEAQWIEVPLIKKGKLAMLIDGDIIPEADSALMYFKIEPGGEAIPHTHEVDEIDFWLGPGEGELTVEGETIKIGKNTATFAPKGAKHSVKATGDEPIYGIALIRAPKL